MTPQEQAFWERANRRASLMTPEMAAAMFRAFAIIRETVSAIQLARLIESGNVDEMIRVAFTDAVLDRAFLPVRERIRASVAQNVRYFIRDLPKGGRINGQIAVSFDYLNPRVIDAVRALDTKVITTLKSDVRETVRAFAEHGLRDGVHPRTVARQIREVVGLAPHQERAVANFRRMLETGDREALTRLLRDKRFDGTLRKALGKDGKGLSAEQIDRMTEAYRKRAIAHNAETNARTAALDSLKAGQRLSIEDALEKGVYNRDRLMKRWVGVMDDRERPEHRAMEGQTVSFNSLFPNGEMVPGESTYNCRCIARYFQEGER